MCEESNDDKRVIRGRLPVWSVTGARTTLSPPGAKGGASSRLSRDDCGRVGAWARCPLHWWLTQTTGVRCSNALAQGRARSLGWRLEQKGCQRTLYQKGGGQAKGDEARAS